MSIWASGSFLVYGNRYFTKSGYESASKSKDWEDISKVDMKEKSIMVTGANSGIGKILSNQFIFVTYSIRI